MKKALKSMILATLILPVLFAAVPFAAAEGWSSEYEMFVMEGKFLESKETEYLPDGFERVEGGHAGNTMTPIEADYFPIWVALHDLDADGTPELIIHNGEGTEAESQCYVYTVKDSEVVYLGPIGRRDCLLDRSGNEKYPGLFSVDGNQGYYEMEYWYLEGGEIKSETVMSVSYYDGNGNEIDAPEWTRVTEDEELYGQATISGFDSLATVDYAMIGEMGWENFLQLCWSEDE